ncbi:MAG: hypothetical protein DMG65_16575 [Candidatus Angelobacter sp. Gp1-AA117]|nr:MAG: hypothetical protein DMG65_16575 [Candidatus Angelobacter sp. Gp1-AA117]
MRTTVRLPESHGNGVVCQMQTQNHQQSREHQKCTYCPSRTPLRPDPDALQRGQQLQFEPPLDEGIRDIVLALIAGGVETFESCEGGSGHSFPEPTVRFEGAASEGLRAMSVALANGLPVFRLRRVWGIIDGAIHGPWWEMTFDPPKDSPLWVERNTAARCAAVTD